MTFRTHIAGGILGAEVFTILAPALTASPTGEFLTVAGTAIIGSLVPDIDLHNSKINKTNGITKFFSRLFTHRGILHAPVFWLIIALILVLVGLPNVWNRYGLCILVGFMIGIFSHLILDTFNARGIMWLWPMGKRKMHVARVKVGSAQETTIGYILDGIDALLLVYIIIDFMFVL